MLREAVLDLNTSMNGGSSDAVYAELYQRLEGRFIDFEPGAEVCEYADAVAKGEFTNGSAG